MLQSNPSTPPSLGADLRALRKARGMTLQDMADALIKNEWQERLKKEHMRKITQPRTEKTSEELVG